MPRRWTLYQVAVGHLDEDALEGEPEPTFATKAEAVRFARDFAGRSHVDEVVEVERVEVSDDYKTTRHQLAALLSGCGWKVGGAVVSRHKGRLQRDALCRRCECWHRPTTTCQEALESLSFSD